VKNLTLVTAQLTILIALIASPKRVFGFCHELDVVQGRIFRAAAGPAPAVAIEWMGHSTFQITSSKGTRVLTDPHGAFDLPRPRPCRSISSPPATSMARTAPSRWHRARR
jgi:hypothetical protein